MIEEELLPDYEADGFSAAAVYVGEQPAFGQLIARHEGQSFPLVWDIEGEVFDEHRIAGVVFPLRVVLDRDGNVAFMGTGEESDPAGGECPEKGGCPCDGRGDLCLTREAIEAALGS